VELIVAPPERQGQVASPRSTRPAVRTPPSSTRWTLSGIAPGTAPARSEWPAASLRHEGSRPRRCASRGRARRAARPDRV